MRASHVIKVAIARPFDEVYEFLLDPKNFLTWAGTPGGLMQQLDADTWLVDAPAGRIMIRFSSRNPYGVLDYQTAPQAGEFHPVVPVRLYANEDGSELTLLWRQRAGDTAERFASDVEWVTSDLERLKSLLEAA